MLLSVSGAGLLAWSGIQPHDRLTWLLEVLPVLIGGALLLATYRRFRFSHLTYALIWAHAILLMIGGHWTYARNPPFGLLQDALDLPRNYYDRLGHIAQGFIPAMIVRELLLRTSPLRPGKWLTVLVLCACLAVSAGYEFFEWWSALALGESADQFLATQGDVWDTQWDMLLCLVGAAAALMLLSRAHDRSLAGRGMGRRARRMWFLAGLALVVAAIVVSHAIQPAAGTPGSGAGP